MCILTITAALAEFLTEVLRLDTGTHIVTWLVGMFARRVIVSGNRQIHILIFYI